MESVFRVIAIVAILYTFIATYLFGAIFTYQKNPSIFRRLFISALVAGVISLIISGYYSLKE